MPDTRHTTDPLAAHLALVTERARELTASHSDEDCPAPQDSCTGHDALRLATMAEYLLKAHRPTVGGDGKDRCCWCRDYHGERSLWPCGEYLAIKAILLGESGEGSAAASTALRPPTSPPPARVLVTPSQAEAARLLLECPAARGRIPVAALEKIAGARDVAATPESENGP